MYECINGFLVDAIDADGFTIEEGGFEVKKGTIWEIDKHNSRVIGGQIRLISKEDSFDWLEISEETLQGNFKLVN